MPERRGDLSDLVEEHGIQQGMKRGVQSGI